MVGEQVEAGGQSSDDTGTGGGRARSDYTRGRGRVIETHDRHVDAVEGTVRR
jgi:hypothetical protein